MHTRTAAGQASIEYIAAIALVVAILVVAGPAVGAPDVGKLVVRKMRLALCVVGGDICTGKMAREAGLQPCPLASDTTGHDFTGSIAIYEVGGRWTLSVTPRSDGTVSVVRAAGLSAGVTDGVGIGVTAGPIALEIGANGVARERVQRARGWDFPDQATADRFLEHSLRNAGDVLDWPPSWESVDDTREVAGMVGLSTGGRRHADRGDLAGVGVAGGATLGARVTRAGAVTIYNRGFWDGPELSVPGMPSVGVGKTEGTFEFTVTRDGPRELAFRVARPSKLGNEVTETSVRLDLRKPENLAAVKDFVGTRPPWVLHVLRRMRPLMEHMYANGTVEHAVFAVSDQSRGVSGSARAAIGVVGGSYKHIKIKRRLLSASARTGGPFPRERVDCQAA